MSMIGNRVVRKEDPQLLTTGGLFVDDVGPEDALHLTFVRSTVAHAVLTEIDVEEARSMPGVVSVHTAASLGLSPLPPANPMLNQEMLRSWLASDRVRYVGEPIAVVLAETKEAAVDAAELVIVDYEYLDAVVEASGDVTLSWDASTDNVGVTEYQVLRNGVEIGVTPTPGFVVPAPAVGSHWYQVRARDAAGNEGNKTAPVRVDIV